MEIKTFAVPGMHCGHCKTAVEGELERVPGVDSIDVDLETKLVTVRGNEFDRANVIAAIDEAGYEAEEIAV